MNTQVEALLAGAIGLAIAGEQLVENGQVLIGLGVFVVAAAVIYVRGYIKGTSDTTSTPVAPVSNQ